jgi:hypothetical protein
MNIQLKLSNTQLQTFVQFLETEITTMAQPKTNADKIVHCLMVKWYKKLAAKCIVMDQLKYTMSVEPETALAFIDFVLPVTLDRASYEGNLVQTIINNFHKQTI